MKKNNGKYQLLFKYSVVWILCAIVIFLPFIPGRKSLVIFDDGINQCYPALKYLGNWYRELFKGNFKMYDFVIGYGDDVIGSLSWYGLGDILLIPFCFAPDNLLEVSYTLSIFFRLFLSGLFFLFAVNKDLPDYAKITGAVMYCFSPFTFQYSFIFLIFSTPIVWVPVIFSGVQEILSERKVISKKLFCGVFFLSMCGFYFLYMTIISFGVLIIVEIVFDAVRKKAVKNILLKAMRVVINSTLGILSASFILIPVVLHFLQSTRTSGISVTLQDLLGYGKFTDALDNNLFFATISRVINNGVEYDQFVLPLISPLALVIGFFLLHHHRRIHKTKTLVMVLIALFAMFSNGAALVMNSFSAIYFRYYLFIFFAFSFMVAEIMPIMHGLWDWIDSLISLIFIMLNVYVLASGARIGEDGVFIFIFVIMAFTMIVSLQKGYDMRIVAAVGVLHVALFGYFYNAPFEKGGRGFNGYTYWLHGAQNDIEESQLSELSKQNNDTEFERMDIGGNSINESLYFDVPTTYSYYSICNGEMLGFLSEYGVSTAIKSTFAYQGIDERQVLESIFSTSYFNNGVEDEVVEQNDYKLPIGFCISNIISNKNISQLSQLEKQMLLTRTVVLEDDDYEEVATKNVKGISFDSEAGKEEESDLPDLEETKITEIPCEIEIGSGISILNGKLDVEEGATIKVIFSMDKIKEQSKGSLNEIYLVMPDIYSYESEDIKVGIKKLRICAMEDENYLPNYDRYINITDVANDGTVDIVFEEAGSYNFGGIKVVEIYDGNYGKVIDKLTDKSMKDFCYINNEISGTIENNENSFMLFSIPYSVGWKAIVDGDETKVYKADYGLMGIMLDSGKHSIELKYTTPGMIVGGIISITSLIGFMFMSKRYNKGYIKNC
ncbi:Uncharacterized membrane protein YfhO [Butyrivibrio proteoclasticus]|uniref:Uncharacterized membrane protein YfhO n=1 Tax=Butyrivibrio proteoclasticus TaxID=43305 RepID=A0A1I5PQ39_9FIRM|nr:YfhO family protein [Butyrivibrio proteoclasticus]SFP36135.1 Uncharacterized membrane protein YfhO [Butyrivibrio proteoclasticus]